MRKYSQLLLATLCSIIFTSVFATNFKNEQVFSYNPIFKSGFDFTIGALYLRPSNSNLSYVSTRQVNPEPPGGIDGDGVFLGQWKTYVVNTDYDFGLIVGLGYRIPDTDNDIKIEWTRYHNTFSDSQRFLGISNGLLSILYMPLGLQHNMEASFDKSVDAEGQAYINFDAVDLSFGYYKNFGANIQTHWLVGLRYMQLDDDLVTSYASFATVASVRQVKYWDGNIDSSYNGVGPLVGVQAQYTLGRGFGLSALFDATILVGNLDFSGDMQDNKFVGGIQTQSKHYSLDWDSVTLFSPGFDAKFAINYSHRLNNCSDFQFELGYQVTQYVNVLQEIVRNAEYNAEESIVHEPDVLDSTITDFGMSGPYLTLSIKFN